MTEITHIIVEIQIEIQLIFFSLKRILTFHCIVFLLPLLCCIMIKTENKWCMVTTHIHQRKWSGTITLLCRLQQPPTHKYVVHSNLDLDKMLIFHLFTCVNIHFLHYIWESNSVHYDLSCVGLFEMSSALENVKMILYKNKCVILPKLLPFVYIFYAAAGVSRQNAYYLFMNFRALCDCCVVVCTC